MTVNRYLSPLVCELILSEALDARVPEFKDWIGRLGAVIGGALLDSGAVDACQELFDRRLWEATYAVGEAPRPRTGRLTSRSWHGITSGTKEIHGLELSLQPHPRVPEGFHYQSAIGLSSAWHANLPNWISVIVPGRYLATAERVGWEAKMLDLLLLAGESVGVDVAHLTWGSPMQFLRHALWELDFNRQLLSPAWASIVGDSHISELGGIAEIQRSSIFAPLLPIQAPTGRRCYLLRVNGPLIDEELRAGSPVYDRLHAFLSPALLPPPPEFP